MKENFVSGRRVVVMGLGESGRAAAELLIQKGASVIIRDSYLNERIDQMARQLQLRGARVETQPAGFTPCRFDLGVLSPGIDPQVPLVRQLRRARVPVVGEVELAARFCDTPVVAVTGTNGKSTTTELVAAALTAGGLRTTACGNLGVPFSDVVRGGDFYNVITLEVSSFQLETIEHFRPRVAVYLNFTPDHLDRYPTLAAYRQAKIRIFMNQTAADFAVVNPACELPALAAKKITISADHDDADYTFRDGALYAGGQKILMQEATNLRGPHNAENQLAALAVADLYGVARPDAIAALRAYRALPHRCELVRELDGVTYINDSKATNIDALEKALAGQTRPVVLIAGGKDKGFDFAPLKALMVKKARAVVAIGEVQNQLVRAWGQHVPCHRAADLAEAVSLGRRLAKPGDTVLLSPGCSSYDMFKNFADRGQQFKELVAKLS
ncbi:MAG: UDP-N-acetylmuramoyl-L-alanine--D-glutamate ligase [Verrucomicrobiales bacterium]|jgi:UDP-N-acetylmuramoylalanine--D-glutamate ligase|nr:UDP-N-acetylmuramoyl-L-alanine--D-glutamate ligase [Verrucomicrobiales bacterium]